MPHVCLRYVWKRENVSVPTLRECSSETLIKLSDGAAD